MRTRFPSGHRDGRVRHSGSGSLLPIGRAFEAAWEWVLHLRTEFGIERSAFGIEQCVGVRAHRMNRHDGSKPNDGTSTDGTGTSSDGPTIDIPFGFTDAFPIRESPRPVYKAVHKKTGNTVHLKAARSRLAVLREARALKRVASPFTPTFVALARSEDRFWIATTWINGEPLSTVKQLATSWPSDFFRALCHLHRHGVVHGDLKPDNVLQCPDGAIVLVDFDFASRSGEEESFASAGATPGFVAPERLSGWPADPRSDLYSAGKVLERLGDERLSELSKRLCSESPAARPLRTDEVLAEVVRTCGTGRVPEPNLALAGWRSTTIDEERLGEGIAANLGCDSILSAGVARLLLEESGGSREFAQELWHQWLSGFTSDAWSTVSTETIRAALPQITEIARRMAQRRFSAAKTDVQEIAARVAQLGEVFTRGVLLSLDVTTERETCEQMRTRSSDDAISTLIDQGFLVGSGHGTLEEKGYRFASHHLWEAACAAIDPDIASEIHGAEAERLRSRVDAERESDTSLLAKLAWHEERSGELESAAAHCFEAAERVDATGEYTDVIELSVRGWRSLREISGIAEDERPSVELLTKLGAKTGWRRAGPHINALGVVGRVDEAISWLDRMREAFDDERTQVLYHMNMAQLMQRTGQYAHVLEHVEKGIALTSADANSRGQLHLHRANALAAQKQATASRCEAELACENLRESGNDRFLSAAVQVLGAAEYLGGDLTAAVSTWSDALEIATRAGAVFPLASAHMNLGAVKNHEGLTAEAKQHFEAAEAIASEHSMHEITWAALANLGEFASRAECWDEGIIYWAEALRASKDTGHIGRVLQALAAIAKLQIRSGRLSEAERTLLMTQPFAENAAWHGDYLRVIVKHMEIRVWYRGIPIGSDVESLARSIVQEREDRWASEQITIHTAISRLLDGSTMEEAIDMLSDEPTLADFRGWHHLARAKILAARGSPEDSLDAHDKAQAAFQTLSPGRYERAFALLEQARAAASAGGIAPHRLLNDCVALARDIHARWIEAQALILRSRLATGGEMA